MRRKEKSLSFVDSLIYWEEIKKGFFCLPVFSFETMGPAGGPVLGEIGFLPFYNNYIRHSRRLHLTSLDEASGGFDLI